MTGHRGRHLEQWMTAAAASGEPSLPSPPGSPLRWSSGSVEGHVNRIKMLNRQLYGRASPDLLRRRVLLAG